MNKKSRFWSIAALGIAFVTMSIISGETSGFFEKTKAAFAKAEQKRYDAMTPEQKLEHNAKKEKKTAKKAANKAKFKKFTQDVGKAAEGAINSGVNTLKMNLNTIKTEQ